MSIPDDLFAGHDGGPTSVKSEPKEENFTGTDMDTDLPPPTPPAVIDVDTYPAPVRRSSNGKGLPYAPVDWPNSGDVWSWRVGRRINKSGFHVDRFIGLPKSLQTPNKPKFFACMKTLEGYLRPLFPDADFDAFFASFTWKIPAISDSPAKAPAVGKKNAEKETSRKNSRSNQKNTATPQPSNSKKRHIMTTNQSVTAAPERQNQQLVKDSIPPPPGFEDANVVLDMSFLHDEPTEGGKKNIKVITIKVIPFIHLSEMAAVEFDDYLNSLDIILAQPLSEEPFSLHAIDDSFVAAEEMAEARMKLSSHLVMDFPSLICFKDVDELVSLARKLQKDPTLTVEELVKLKLIEDIPSFCKFYLENREVMEQADKFFESLMANKAKVTSLRQEYSALKEQVTYLQSEVDSNTLIAQEIEDQIGQLKSRHAELSRLIDDDKKRKDDLTHKQNLVATSIPGVVHEIQVANAEKPEWERKKENAAKREAEILAKFAPLDGFSL